MGGVYKRATNVLRQKLSIFNLWRRIRGQHGAKTDFMGEEDVGRGQKMGIDGMICQQNR